MPTGKKIFEDLLDWRRGLLVDLCWIFFLICFNSVSLFAFWGEPDKSNSFSAPLIPVVSQAISWLTDLPLAKSITISLSIFIIFGPVSLYFLANKLGERRLAGFLASLIFSLPDKWMVKGRVNMAFLVGDGGHIAALSLVSIVAFFLLDFLRSGNFTCLSLASFFMGLVALASPFGLLIGIMIVTVVAFSEFMQGSGRIKILRFLVFLGLAVGFVAFWYNPGFVVVFLQSNQGMAIRKTLLNLVPISFVIVPILASFGYLLFERKSQLQPLYVALGLFILFSLVSFADHVGRLFPSHPRRYLPALGFSLSFLLGILAVAISDYLKFTGQFHKVKLNPLGRSLAQKAFWLSTLGIAGVITIFSWPSVWRLPESQVLGLWQEGIVTGEFWEIKSHTGSLSSLIGYVITGLTVFLVSLFWLKIRSGQKIKLEG